MLSNRRPSSMELTVSIEKSRSRSTVTMPPAARKVKPLPKGKTSSSQLQPSLPDPGNPDSAKKKTGKTLNAAQLSLIPRDSCQICHLPAGRARQRLTCTDAAEKNYFPITFTRNLINKRFSFSFSHYQQ